MNMRTSTSTAEKSPMPTGEAVASRAGEPAAGRRRTPSSEMVRRFLGDVALPLGLYYGLRLAGVNQWLALVVSSVVPVVQLIRRLAIERRVSGTTLFTLSITVCSAAVTLLTGDPRLLLARESYFTAILGLWMAGSVPTRRPFVYMATVKLLPEATAREWEAKWEGISGFRRAMRVMTAAWSAAFLLDSVARVVMAYTLPVDLVPVLSAALLIAMLVVVVRLGKVYGKRQLAG
ncbi:VC0807 family protein [Streptomyces sp. NPDC048506]|uniref:VC0807 family protein n=1 Tax=Streptomyces sp. NPDC048506 TaxID=3155028 RepID=UPI003438A1DF